MSSTHLSFLGCLQCESSSKRLRRKELIFVHLSLYFKPLFPLSLSSSARFSHSDSLLAHFLSFSATPTYHTLPQCIEDGLPLFHLPPNQTKPVGLQWLTALFDCNLCILLSCPGSFCPPVLFRRWVGALHFCHDLSFWCLCYVSATPAMSITRLHVSIT